MIRGCFSRVVLVATFAMLALALAPSHAQRPDEPASETAAFVDALRPRPLGPAIMGGRISALAVVDSRPTTMYVGAASGGVWKTTNNGTTWTCVFDGSATASIGDVAIAPSNPDIVWIGTGESNPRNSVAWGDGVYRSTDAGKTWQHMGLAETAHIGRIIIHPKNPDIVYVAALGRIWGPNRDRGLYKTIDGGKTWTQSKYVNDETGFIDVAIDPADPETLYAAAYQMRRDAFSGGNPAVQWGPGSGLFKTADGGKSWTAMTRGLPTRPLGRCGTAVSAKDPRVVYAVIQTDKSDTSNKGQGPRPNNEADLGGIFRSEDKGETWAKLNDLCPRPFYYGQIRLDASDDRRVYVLGVDLFVSSDAGKNFRNDGARFVHADHHALWVNPKNSDHLVLGNDGGLYFSHDRGENWEHVNNLPISQFYAVGFDLRQPYHVYGGLQDNGTWSAPVASRRPEGITPGDWQRVLGADGFQTLIDANDPDTVYAEAQWGRVRRIDMKTGKKVDIRPKHAATEPEYRFNWNSPLLISAHNSRILYFGGNHVFRSLDRGDHWEKISPDLTHGKPGASANAGHTLTALAESPRKPSLLYAGSDDGRVHVSRDGGATWTDVSSKIPGVPADRCVSRIECSRYADNVAYLALDRHRSDDRAPYLFRTSDAGLTWEPIAHDLPRDAPVYVIREDLRNPELLFVGTETGLFASLNGGKNWRRVRGGFPTVAVHDVKIHPRARELVVATHGRGLWVVDISPLQDVTPAVLAAGVHLFDVKPGMRFHARETNGWAGARAYRAPNPSPGVSIWFSVKSELTFPVRVTIADAEGREIAVLPEIREAGLHRVQWDLHLPPEGGAEEGEAAPAGDYVARIKVGNQVLTKKFHVEVEE
jgi:photosystem II stability/assembly factor-like uncharacterized protein